MRISYYESSETRYICGCGNVSIGELTDDHNTTCLAEFCSEECLADAIAELEAA